ncbi:unnamed protein product [Protopolystoma xenopodis]|uniref:Uncharacterized protein n=1 Tax=Protopolystoma xenopodis TaxID=117903 RepID=A0A3S5FFS7_9PLAT|nr:unnamed protein product [Protopolystoma xenopodis]
MRSRRGIRPCSAADVKKANLPHRRGWSRQYKSAHVPCQAWREKLCNCHKLWCSLVYSSPVRPIGFQTFTASIVTVKLHNTTPQKPNCLAWQHNSSGAMLHQTRGEDNFGKSNFDNFVFELRQFGPNSFVLPSTKYRMEQSILSRK